VASFLDSGVFLLRSFSAAWLWPSFRCCALHTAEFLLLSFCPLPPSCGPYPRFIRRETAGFLVGKQARPLPSSGARRDRAGREGQGGARPGQGRPTRKCRGQLAKRGRSYRGLKPRRALWASAEWRGRMVQDSGQAKQRRMTRQTIFASGRARTRRSIHSAACLMRLEYNAMST